MANTQLHKTFSGAGNRKTFTLSFWVKRTKLSTGMYVFNVGNQEANPQAGLEFQGNNTLTFWNNSGSGNKIMTTTQSFSDNNAWYHLVFSIDTTQSTASDRVKIYVNGEQITSFSTATYPDQNYDYEWNGTQRHTIGAYYNNQSYFDGILSHIHFIDGTAYPASTFGETDATTGEWKIKTNVTATYGTNGFFILKDGNSVTDQSGNSNNFTVAGGTLTNTEDCPSNVFATLNALDNYYAGATLSNGNTKSVTGTNTAQVLATIGVSTGKWYWEVKATNLPSTYGTIGICPTSPTATGNYISSRANEYMYYSAGNLYYNGGSTGTYASYTTGDIIGVAMDLDNNRLFFSKNGTWQNSADPTTSTGAYTITAPASTDSGFYFPAVGYWDTGNGTFECNFGNGYFGTTAVTSAGTGASTPGTFEYNVPNGYQPLTTKGLNT